MTARNPMFRLAAAVSLLAATAAAGPTSQPVEVAATTRPAATRPVADTFLRNGVTAHRGASHAFPENTMRAFRGAIDLGVDWVELDVFLTKDGQVVVSHDPTTGRVADVDVRIADATYAELESIDVAAGFRRARNLSIYECPPSRMPLLREVLETAAAQDRTRISIQPKDENVDAAMAIVQALGLADRVGFNDGSLAKMARVKRLDPNVRVFWDRPARLDLQGDIAVAREHGFEALVLNDAAVTPAAIAAIRAAGLEAGAWTVNETPRLRELVSWGIDRIYTDRPEALLQIRGSQTDVRSTSVVTARAESRRD